MKIAIKGRPLMAKGKFNCRDFGFAVFSFVAN